MQITKFILNASRDQLTVEFSDKFRDLLPVELLRVYSPATNKKQGNIEAHKRQVKLILIEPLGKYGFRLHFDDQHQAVYATELIRHLLDNKESLLQKYLSDIKAAGINREATIDIKQL